MCLQFSTKWQQRCCSSNITRESVPDPGTSCSKWAVTNSNAARWAKTSSNVYIQRQTAVQRYWTYCINVNHAQQLNMLAQVYCKQWLQYLDIRYGMGCADAHISAPASTSLPSKFQDFLGGVETPNSGSLAPALWLISAADCLEIGISSEPRQAQPMSTAPLSSLSLFLSSSTWK